MVAPFYHIQELPSWHQISLIDKNDPTRHAFLSGEELGVEYEAEEMEMIRAAISRPIGFVLASSDHEFLREILLRLEVEGLIDDTFGKIWNSREFFGKLRLEPTWDWRRPVE